MSGVANQFETVARYQKARKVADVLIKAGATDPKALASDHIRALAVRLADVREPSEVTWELVKHLVSEGR